MGRTPRVIGIVGLAFLALILLLPHGSTRQISSQTPQRQVLDQVAALPTAPETAPLHSSGPALLAPADPVTAERVREAYLRLPLTFEENAGQLDPRVDFLSRGAGYQLFLTSSGAVLVLKHPAKGTPAADGSDRRDGTVVRMNLLGASAAAEVSGSAPFAGRAHYFRGGERHANVATFGRVEYRGVYPGVDMVYYGNEGRLEYDFVVAPGADPGAIRIGFEGIEGFELDASDNLVLKTPSGNLLQHAPVVYQVVDGVRRSVESRYAPAPGGEIGFELGPYDAGRELVIDPVLVYATYLGGASVDFSVAVAVDAGGNAYVTGSTNSPDFPLAGGFQPAVQGNFDAFVTKISPTGDALVYSTYLGGADFDTANGIAVDAAGNAYVTGGTMSDDFPVVGGVQAARGGSFDVFVAKINPTGDALVYSTYVGGATMDQGMSIEVDAAGAAYVTGNTSSSDFPTTPGAFQPVFIGGSGIVFVAKLDPSGAALAYSTYLGTSDNSQGLDIAVDAAGCAHVVGSTNSPVFPVTAGALQPSFLGVMDGFLVKFDASGSALLYATYLGGSANDNAQSVAVDEAGYAYVVGSTSSTDFPVAAAVQPLYGGGNGDGFLTKVDPSGAAILFSTFLGGANYDFANGVAINGGRHVAGYTLSADFPTVDPIQDALSAPSNGTQFEDAFVTTLPLDGSVIEFSTYLGGTGSDIGNSIAVTEDGNMYLAGRTLSAGDFPTVNAIQDAGAGSLDCFVARIGVPVNNDEEAPLFANVFCDSDGFGGVLCNATVTDETGVDAASVAAEFTRPDGTAFSVVPQLTLLDDGFNALASLAPDQAGVWKVTWTASDTLGNAAAASAHFYCGRDGSLVNLVIDETNGPVTGLENLDFTRVEGPGVVRLVGPLAIEGRVWMRNVSLDADVVLQDSVIDGSVMLWHVDVNSPVTISGAAISGKFQVVNALLNAPVSVTNSVVESMLKIVMARVEAPVTVSGSSILAPVMILSRVFGPVEIIDEVVDRPLVIFGRHLLKFRGHRRGFFRCW